MKQAPRSHPIEMRARFRGQLFQWREVHPQASIYLLLDPNHPVAPHDPLRMDRLRSRPIDRRVEAVCRPDLTQSPELLPQLLQLYEAGERGYVDEELLDLTLQCATARCASVNGAYIAAWLCSEREPASIAAHIARSGELFDLAKNKRRYIPLFEPHRFALLADDPDAAPFVRHWLEPFKGWMFMDASGALRTVAPPSIDLATSEPRTRAGLHHEQFAAQGRLHTARLVLLAVDRSGIALARQPEWQVDRAMIEAQRQGLRHTEDVIFHALNTFTLGSSWAKHPRAAELIRQVGAATGSDELRLAQLMQQLPDDTLDEIAFASRGPSQS